MGRTKEKAPKAYSLRVTETALQDLDNITGYIAYIKHEPINAIRVGDEILKTIDRIKKNPTAFRECEEILTSNKIYRKAICLSWLIVFRIKHEVIVVLRIIHSHRSQSIIKNLRKVK